MKVNCLMGTYGRHSLACEALACFLGQTALADANMLVYNQHPIPLRFDHPRVRVVNETPPAGPVRFIIRRMFELADADADLFQMWHDDDLYLPWHLECAMASIGTAKAWKPASSWVSTGNVRFVLDQNFFEGSWMFRADYARAAAMDTHLTYLDHPVYMQTHDADLLKTTELGSRAPYIYRWSNGIVHNSEFGGSGTTGEQADRLAFQRSRSRDVRPDGLLEPADLAPRWQQFLLGTQDQITAEEWEWNRQALGQ